MKPATHFSVFFLLIMQAYCGQDLDLRFGAVGGVNERSISNWAPALDLQYRCSVPLAQSFSVLLGEEFRSIHRLSSTLPLPRPECNYPVNAVTAAGIAYSGYGLVQVKGFSHVLYQSDMISFPVAKEVVSPLREAFMTQRFKNGADLFVDLPLWRFRLVADALYNDLVFDFGRDTLIQIDTTRQRLTRKNSHDADVWGRASLTYEVFDKKLWLKTALLHKNDLNTFKGYNITGYFAGLEGNTTVFSNMLTISGDALARYYESEIMGLKGYGDKFGTTSHLRMVVKMPSGFFIKSDYVLESASTMRKFRGELAIRKAWMNQLGIEGGFWTTAGSLFPRQCAYVSSTIPMSPRDIIAPSAKIYTHWTGYYANSDSSMSVYRSDLGLMFRHDFSKSTLLLVKNLSFNCGAMYRWITNMPYPEISPQNVDIFIGLSNWL